MSLRSPLQMFSAVSGVRDVLIKRDDLLEYGDAKGVKGNKGRKLYGLMQQNWKNSVLVSYGGTQSNAMNALSLLACSKQVPFVYYHRMTRNKPKTGNWQLCQQRSMITCELDEKQYEALTGPTFFQPHMKFHQLSEALLKTRNFSSYSLPVDSILDYEVKYIKQGGADPISSLGLTVLATELVEQTKSSKENFVIALPCGTGTTALYLAKHINEMDAKHISRVVPIPCVGGYSVLWKQMQKLEPNFMLNPLLYWLDQSDICKHPFAKCDKRDLSMWKELTDSTGIEFDLIYAPRTWRAIAASIDKITDYGKLKLIYIHTGGVEGNSSQLERYGMIAQSVTEYH